MARPLIHPRMLDGLRDFYPSTCTIQEAKVLDRNAHGEEVEDWVDLTGHVDLPCAVSTVPPGRSHEVKRPDMTYAVGSHYLGLRGYYPAITSVMRAVVSGAVYDILAVIHDSQAQTTRLNCEVVAV